MLRPYKDITDALANHFQNTRKEPPCRTRRARQACAPFLSGQTRTARSGCATRTVPTYSAKYPLPKPPCCFFSAEKKLASKSWNGTGTSRGGQAHAVEQIPKAGIAAQGIGHRIHAEKDEAVDALFVRPVEQIERFARVTQPKINPRGIERPHQARRAQLLQRMQRPPGFGGIFRNRLRMA